MTPLRRGFYFYKHNVMDAVEAFKNALIVRDHYNDLVLDKGVPISIDDLTEVVQRFAELDEIRILSVGYEHANILGRLVRYEKRAEIHFAAGLNRCHKRYVVAKELSQLVIDSPESYTKDFRKLVASLVDDSFQVINDEVTESEDLAHLVGCEFLMPADLRNSYIEELIAGHTTYFKIAQRHLMPERVVKRILYPAFNDRIQVIMRPLKGS